MKPIFSVIAFIIFTVPLFAQPDLEIILQTLRDENNIDITTALYNKKPKKIRLMDSTETWDNHRFKINGIETLTIPGQEILNDEHHPYNTSYLFKDRSIDSLFPQKEKDYLYNESNKQMRVALFIRDKKIRMIKSFKKIKKGFFFIVTSPIYSSDGQYAFIDTDVFLREKEDKTVDECYFASFCILYKRKEDGSWEKMYKREILIL